MTPEEEKLWQLIQNRTTRIGSRITVAAVLSAIIIFFIGLTISIVLRKISLNEHLIQNTFSKIQIVLALTALAFFSFSLVLILAAILFLREANKVLRERLRLRDIIRAESEITLIHAFRGTRKWLFWGTMFKTYALGVLTIAIVVDMVLIFSLF